MNNFYFEKEKIEKRLFKYPCVDTNSLFLSDKTICVFGNNDCTPISSLENLGARILFNPENKDTSFSDIGIVFPPKTTKQGEELYFEILDYFVEILQLLVHKQKSVGGYKHIVVILPPEANKYSTEYDMMAYYAIYGLTKGLGKRYGEFGLFVNGLITNLSNPKAIEYIRFLVSDNACNIVGQVIEI